jgi:CheY-like chemotaxis protein
MVVATGDDALALIRERDVSPDVLLCDYNLRGSANGLESIKTLRAALARDVPAIVMTGDTRMKTMEAITSHDISVLIKPFVADELIQLIQRIRRGENAHTPT